MSLYSDLNEVLTPYAQRIKGLAQENTELKADLGDVTDIDTGDTTVVGAINTLYASIGDLSSVLEVI